MGIVKARGNRRRRRPRSASVKSRMPSSGKRGNTKRPNTAKSRSINKPVIIPMAKTKPADLLFVDEDASLKRIKEFRVDVMNLTEQKDKQLSAGYNSDPSLVAALYSKSSRLVTLLNKAAISFIKGNKRGSLARADRLLREALEVVKVPHGPLQRNPIACRNLHVLTLNNVACLYCAKVGSSRISDYLFFLSSFVVVQSISVVIMMCLAPLPAPYHSTRRLTLACELTIPPPPLRSPIHPSNSLCLIPLLSCM